MMIPVAILWGIGTERCFQSDTKHSREKHTARPELYVERGVARLYAQLEGLSRNTSQPNETALVGGQLTRNAPWGSVFGSGGYLRHAMNGAVVDTDIGYPFSLSLDRNREGMQSRQLGVNYRLTPQFTLTFAPIVTRGYESSKRDVRIEGTGILGGMNYRVSEGPLQGMNFFLAADKGREKRDGSALGDRLNYWDVKMSIQYDFMLK